MSLVTVSISGLVVVLRYAAAALSKYHCALDRRSGYAGRGQEHQS